MNDNIYAPPSTQPEIINTNTQISELASRWSRLGAVIIDSLIMTSVTIPVMYFTGGFDGLGLGRAQHSFLYTLAIGLVGIIAFAAINLNFLIKSGQTIGKKALGIKIVDMEGNLPTLTTHLIKRYATFFLPRYIPFIGIILSLINVFFIFGQHKRCIHDLVADTKVVNS